MADQSGKFSKNPATDYGHNRKRSIYFPHRQQGAAGKTMQGAIMRISIVKSNGRNIRTLDNPLNTWVRSVDDGKLYRVDR